MKDPAMILLQKKQDHVAKMASLKRCERTWSLKEDERIRDGMREYMELMESDPAPLLSNEFDWHCFGGNLEVVKIQGEEFLAQPSMCDSFAIRLLDSASKHNTVKLDTQAKWLNKNYTHEIMSSDAYVGVRKRKTVDFVRCDADFASRRVQTPIEFKWNSEIATSCLINKDLLFIDVGNILYRTNVARKLAVDMLKLPVIEPANQLPVCIGAISKNVISYNDLKTLNLVDFREREVNTIFTKENFLARCEEFSYHKKSLHDNLLYLASSHFLYGIDVRQPKGLLMHWTHQLVMQPTMMKSVMLHENEVICLASNSPGDMKVFNCSKGEKLSWCINRQPVKPHNVMQSFNKMRDKGNLLLSDHVKSRLNLSTTGIALIPNEDKSAIKLFTQNSLGDIFKSYLCCDAFEENDKMLVTNFSKMDKFLETTRDPDKYLSVKERVNREELQFTNIVQLKGLAKVFRCEKLQKDDDHDMSRMRTTRAPKWKIDLDEAMEYRDALSQHLLAEWDLQIEETRPSMFAEALTSSDFKLEKGADKVSRWLEATAVEDPTAIEGQDEITEQPRHDDTFTQELPSTQKTNVSKSAKKLTKRHKGF